jgi:hypothetical protein
MQFLFQVIPLPVQLSLDYQSLQKKAHTLILRHLKAQS